MSILNDLLSIGSMGESGRLDYVVREQDKLQARFAALLGVLAANGALTPDDVARLAQANPDPAASHENGAG